MGKYASEGVRQGQLLDPSMISTQGFLQTGTVALGVPLKTGRVPVSGLQPGDVVQVLSVPAQGPSKVLVARATVSSTTQQQAGGGGLTGAPASSSNDQAATLVVASSAATLVAQAAAQDAIALVLVERGATTGTGRRWR
ncbi:hypothetical protein GCM10025868_35270 [Angustibacter aerolatus]|uniref:SAF domain-containing protein n=1 Tax=Angustibacter aerolatus TaxID=1162965 RepID=A0ABQ6JN62_9ACTN|nr:hypothetical protein GCM10025868_35270 [Angustibacter aerolatus]